MLKRNYVVYYVATVLYLGLAISDLGCLVTVIWMDIFYTPAVAAADPPFDVLETAYVTAGLTHVTFTRLSSWVTALITLERCLCIIAPLQVGTFFS